MLKNFKYQHYIRNLVCDAYLREGYIHVKRSEYESFKIGIAKFLNMSQFNFTILKYDANHVVVGVTLTEEVFQGDVC